MRTTVFVLATMLLAGSSPAAETPAEALTRGKLESDTGKLGAAAAAFTAVAHAPDASAAQRWEALVRLGVALRSAGDAEGSVAAFEEVWTAYGQDPEAIRFLLQALGSALPGKERWDEVWQEISFTVDRSGTNGPLVRVTWPGVPALETTASALTASAPIITLNFKDANLFDICRLFADVTGLNVVVQPGVHGQVTFSARERPLTAMEKMLAPNGYVVQVDGNVAWIGRPDAAPRKLQEVVALGAAKDRETSPRPTGETIDLDVKDVPLSDVLRQVAAHGGGRVVVGEGVAGRVTLRLSAVPWQQAFDLIATVNGLVWERQGDVITVRPRPRP